VSGFTLIELVAVIAILAILAVTALPKFFDLRQDAASAAVTGVGGALSSASTINYAKRLTTSAGFSSITACAATDANLLVPGGIPVGYTLSGAAGITNGSPGTCVLTAIVSGVTATATFIIFGAS
jgi:MSHA pilin protein MshA